MDEIGDGAPGLGVGFAIETGGSFEELMRLQNVMDSTEAKVVSEAAKIERATSGMINLSGATAQITAFGNAHSREMQNVTRDRNNAEKSGEAIIRQLQRQAETYGKTASEIRNMRAEQKALAAEAQGLTELAARVRAANAAMNELEHGTGGVTTAAVRNRMAMQGASYQVQDFITQVSMGANPVNAFAVQGAQLAGQFSSVEGKAGAVARFFMGPWGLAITAGLMLLGPFVAKLFEGNNELDKAVEKLKKDAHETEVAAKAKDMFARSVQGLTQATLENKKALDQLDKAAQTSIQTTLYQIARTIDSAEAQRLKTAETIRTLEAEIELNKERARVAGNDARITGTLNAESAAARDRVEQLKKDLATTEGTIASNRAMLGDALSRRVVEIASQQSDALARIKRNYEGPNGLIELARKAASAEEVRNGTLARQVAILKQKQAAEEDAEQKRQQGMQRTAQIGREIDLAEARRIAQSIGARITSEERSYAEQKRLYDKYMAYKAGRGPWAALAAAPGTSDHERGNALDIAKTPGMSLTKIRNAFREAGVSIKQLLDEGDHFHIAWKKGADGAAAAAKKLADTQGALAKQFDPVEAAAIEYRDTLRSIGEAKLDPATAQRYAAAAADAFRKARAAAFTLPSMAGITADAEAQTAAEKSAEEFKRNIIKPLQDELALYGLVGAARASAALELEKEAFIAKNIGEGIEVATARWNEYREAKEKLIDKDREAESIKRMADEMDRLTVSVREAGDAFARSFGRGGAAISDAVNLLVDYRKREIELNATAKREEWDRAKTARENGRLQIGLYGDLAESAKGFFDEKSKGYAALTVAEKTFRAIQFALSLRAMAQDVIETASSIAKSGARTAVHAVEAVVKAIASLPFPLNLIAGAATAAAIASLGVSAVKAFSGGGAKRTPANEGAGTVFGDSNAKSESLKNAIEALKEVDTLTSTYAREMMGSLKSIDSQIGNFTKVILRMGDINASAGVTEGFKTDSTGKLLSSLVDPFGIMSKIPVIGGIFSGIKSLIGSLFGSTTKVVGSGLYGGAQSIGSILNGGFDASYFSDIEKKKKFFGITTGTSYSTQYGAADPALEQQFTLILRSFSDAIAASAGPLGEATADVLARLNGFVVTIGKIDLKGLTGEQIQDKLTAIFGAAADGMASAAFPGIQQFQKVGEGAFETLVRVASTVDAVSGTLDLLGQRVQGMGVAAKLGLADQFESISALTNAAESYFNAFYSKEEQNAARMTQLSGVFVSLGLTMPSTLSAFRQLVEAQDLTTAAGQQTYATLLQLAPAFADLNAALADGKSAADVATERADLERQLLQAKGDTAALRALDLAKLDASNRALQQQIWAIQDAQEAAKAADELRQAWQSVGDSIMDEVKRIRGLNGIGDNSFAGLMGQFNAATTAARGGDMDAAKSLPQLSQALLTVAAAAATSRQELARVQAQTAASLEATYGVIGKLTAPSGTATNDALVMAASAITAATTPGNDNSDDLRAAIEGLKAEVAQMRSEASSGNAVIAAGVNKTASILERTTLQSGGDAISTVQAA